MQKSNCTEKGTAGESLCRKATDLNGARAARQPVAKCRLPPPFFAPYRQKKEDFFMSEKKVGKRLLTWVLVLVMTLSLLPLNVLADEAEEPSNVKYGMIGTNGTWAETEKNGTGTNNSTGITGVKSVSKTAKPTTDKYGKIISNQYDSRSKSSWNRQHLPRCPAPPRLCW